MTDHPYAEMYKKAFTDFGGEDSGERLAGFLADDVVWWQIGSTEPLHGKKAVIDSMSGIPAEVDFNVDIHDVVSNDEHLVALIVATVGTGDQSFVYRTAEVCHVADGKITERWAFSDDTQRIDEFFSQFG